MSGRRREGLAPNLFPFLAVLVCTLGTLILLLALVAQNAGDTFAAADSQPPAEDAGPDEEAVKLVEAAEMIDRQLREAVWHRDQTVKMRDAQTAELEERRDRLAHLEDHVRRLHDDLKSLTTEVEKAMEKPGESSDAQATLDKVLLDIEAEKEAIGNLETELKSETPRIVIVPHKGPNGTDRRPIYIECRADGVYLQPGNQRIKRVDLEPRVGFANPLESALRTIRLHAMQSYGDAIAPYPLLVVRPDGIESYSVARAAMTNWDDQFGYELVPGEVDLAFPTNDPTLDTKVAAAIGQAVAQRQALAMRFGNGGGGSGTGSGSGAAGGDPRSDGYSAEGYAAGGGTPLGQYSGGQNAGGGYSSLAGDGTASGDGAMNGATPAGRTAASPPASSLPVLSAAKMSRGATSGAIGDARMAGFTPPPGASPSQPSVSPSGPYDGNGPDGDLTGPFGSTGPAGSTSPSGTASGSPQTQSGVPQGFAANGAPDGAATDPSDYAGPVGQSVSGSATGASETATGKSAGSVSSGAAGGSGGTQAASSGSPSSAQSSSQGQPQDASQSAGGTPSITMGNSQTPPVTRVGKDWALPPDISSSRGTEMLRLVRVECHADHFVLIGEGGRGAPTAYSFADGDINRASLELATAVRDRASGWGAAMQGARWQPVLDVAVAPGGEARFQQLTRLLDGSGLMIQARGAK